MQLVVKQDDNFVKELHFAQGPVYVGRELDHQVCLQDDSVNFEHTVLCGADTTRWFAEDLTREQKTKVNNKPIKREQLRDGDVLSVGKFTIEIQLVGDAAKAAPALSISEVAAQVAARPPKEIIRLFSQKDSPDIRMPPKRYKDYMAATIAIQKADSKHSLLKALLAVTVQQFGMLHTFIGLRKDPSGDFTCEVGKRRTGQNLALHELVFQHFLTEAMEKGQYILLPILPENKIYERIRSAVIAPILSPAGCHGIIYTDNCVDDQHYTINDLDYLILLAVQAGIKLRLL